MAMVQPLPAPGAMEDNQLAGQVAEGNSGAFAELVRRHSKRFYAVAYGVVLNQQDAEDVVQEAFLKLWQGKACWDGTRQVKFTTWFYRIVYNQALDTLKKKPGFALVDAEDVALPDAQPTAETALGQQQDQQQLTALLQQLPERQRSAIVLVYKEELKQQEAATVMGLGIKAFESLLGRAKKALRERMEYDG